MKFKNYIFDLGKVIVRYDPEIMTSAYVKDPKDIAMLKDIVFDRLYWDKLDDGSITDEELIECVKKRLPEKYHSAAELIYSNWYHNMPLIEKTVELIKKIKSGGGKLYLLSNISIGFAEKYIDDEKIKNVLDIFDGLVFSGPLGIAKPNEKIFKYILEKYRLISDECCFIDDNPDNIEGARKFGINAFLFSEDHLCNIEAQIL